MSDPIKNATSKWLRATLLALTLAALTACGGGGDGGGSGSPPPSNESPSDGGSSDGGSSDGGSSDGGSSDGGSSDGGSSDGGSSDGGSSDGGSSDGGSSDGGGGEAPQFESALLKTIPGSVAAEFHVAVDSAGDAIAVWQERTKTGTQFVGTIWASRFSAGGWSEPSVVGETVLSTGSNTYRPRVAMDDAGNAVVVWAQISGTNRAVWANRYTAGAGWEEAKQVSVALTTATNPMQTYPDVAIGQGAAFMIWQQSDSGNLNVQSARYLLGEDWATWEPAPTQINSAGVFASYTNAVRIGADRNGGALAVWQQLDQQTKVGGVPSIWSARYSASGGWGAPEQLESGALESLNLGFAADNSGAAVALWSQWDGSKENVYAARHSPSAGWDEPALVGQSATRFTLNTTPKAILDRFGNVAITFADENGASGNIVATLYTPGSGWMAPLQLELPGYYIRVQVSTDGAGSFTVVWRHSSYTGSDAKIGIKQFKLGAGWSESSVLIEKAELMGNYWLATNFAGDSFLIWYELTSDYKTTNIRASRFRY